MRWPWLSWDAHVSALGVKDEMIALLRQDLAETRAELRQLRTPTMTASVAPQPVMFIQDEGETRIRKAINESASVGGKVDFGLQAHLRSYANQLKRDGLSVDEIEQRLGTWVTSEPSDMAG